RGGFDDDPVTGGQRPVLVMADRLAVEQQLSLDAVAPAKETARRNAHARDDEGAGSRLVADEFELEGKPVAAAVLSGATGAAADLAAPHQNRRFRFHDFDRRVRHVAREADAGEPVAVRGCPLPG